MVSSVTVYASELQECVRSILIAADVPPEKAELVAESLVSANLRGVDSHGVHLLPHYVRQLKVGNIDPGAEGHVVSEAGGCLLFDGERGIGQYVSDVCCRHAVRLGRIHGLAIVVSRASNHFGAAAFWAQRISSHGMIGLVVSNASPAVAPWQGKNGRIGTNPLCMSVPSKGKGFWLLDMATTTVAMNRIIKAAGNDEKTIPTGWAMDSEGNPSTDTEKALHGLLMPLGGYKGSGLGMMIEILCGVLGGGAMSTEVGGVHIVDRPMNTSQMFMAIDVSRFLSPEEFDVRMEHLVETVKSSRPAHGYDEVLVAGDPEWRTESYRKRKGIPIDASVWSKIVELAADLNVPLPECVES
jgi:LDH2 family malate/lactate/ureidoglycolate dehydrogenase